MKTLINLSGGIDSTFALYRYLKNNPEEKALIHFCHLINHEGREPYESKAVSNILQWLSENNLNNFKFVESQFDYKSLGNIIRDVELLSFLTAVICQNPAHQTISEVILSVNKDEKNRYTNKFYNDELIRREKLVKLIAKRYIKFKFPICEMTKTDIIQEMPKELFDLCWYCRRPKNGKVCNSCHTCNLVNNSLISINNIL